MNYTGVSVFPTDSDGSQFWALVNWCHDRGAQDFSLFIAGFNGYSLAAQAKDKVHALLARFELGVEKRICPDAYSWDEVETTVWSLSSDSLKVLRDTDIEVPKGYRKRALSPDAAAIADSVAPSPQPQAGFGIYVGIPETVSEPTMDPESYEMYLCIYKDGLPMLAVITEQYSELLFVLTDDDLVAFEQLRIEANCDFMPHYDVLP